jgi:ABC-type transporter MlaC component
MKPVDNIECKIKFDVPDGYFDTLADNVMQRIDFDDKQRKKRRSTVVRSIFAMAAAAAIAGVVVFGPQNRPNATHSDAQQQFSDHYLTNISRQYSDINVIDYIDQSNNTDDAKTEYDADLLAMYASPINFMY